jgi:hypothetical protein
MGSKWSSAVKRLVQTDLEYFDEQFMYGHREALLSYANRDKPRISEGSILIAGLQHGWLSEAGIWRLRKRNLARAVRLVWNQKWESKLSGVVWNQAIGSPWLYLLIAAGLTKTRIESNHFQENRLRLVKYKHLIIPGHSGLSLKKDLGGQALHFAKFANPKDSLVLLFWLDFCNPTIREAFTDLGFKVECVGFGSARGMDAQFDEGGRTQVLPRLLTHCLESEIILTDEISSASFYGLSLGLSLQYVPNSISETFSSVVVKGVHGSVDGFFDQTSEWIQKVAPEICRTRINPKKFLDLAWYELGFESMLSPDELAALPWVDADISQEYCATLKSFLAELKLD